VTAPVELVVASGNAKKLFEIRALLEPLGVRTLAPPDVGGLPDVDEDAPDFEGNARKKAASGARACGRWCLADDSGLVVDALHGAPGVFSARFAGEHGNDAANNALLLERLAEVAPRSEQRTAAFECAVALARPDGTVVATTRGRVGGRILAAASGVGGFGYDPLFALDDPEVPDHPGTGRSFADLGPGVKGSVSHRGRALRALVERLPDVFAEHV
jgi:XTP/dITP diphosphohydrolase